MNLEYFYQFLEMVNKALFMAVEYLLIAGLGSWTLLVIYWYVKYIF